MVRDVYDLKSFLRSNDVGQSLKCVDVSFSFASRSTRRIILAVTAWSVHFPRISGKICLHSN